MDNPNPQTPATGSAAKLDQVQGQVNEVKVILKDNISKVLERGDRLDDLIGKTDDLQASQSLTHRQSTAAVNGSDLQLTLVARQQPQAAFD
ncbi:Vesicle-associated membrane protein 3 [Collichthys lucidus]|uniref:Vesicle-associated membrane protein 3 n=1 Tax=Collichthys lucidus TaxID=240159 RepID=A0A4U5VAF3_COLLU|nr:Vesicle-associated membrane protein 3 [Collichthys lucidus]